jgi:Cupin-like domain
MSSSSPPSSYLKVIELTQDDQVPDINMPLPSLNDDEEGEGEEWTLERIAKVKSAREQCVDAFCFPLSKTQFVDEHLNAQRPLAIVGGTLNRIEALLDEHLFSGDIRQLATHTASETMFAWLQEKGAENEEKGKSDDSDSESESESTKQVMSIDVDDVEKAMALYWSGASLYFRSPQAFAELFCRAFSGALGFDFGGTYGDGAIRSEVEVFCSRQGHVTDWHHDYMLGNFTVQLRGAKRWQLRRGAYKFPLRGATPHYRDDDARDIQHKLHAAHEPRFDFEAPDSSVVEEVTLRAGDVLFFPAGCWHRVSAVEGDSLSINVSLMPERYVDSIGDAFSHVLRADESLRAPIRVDSHEQARRIMAERLERAKRLVNALSVDELLPRGAFLPRWPLVNLDEPNAKEKASVDTGDSSSSSSSKEPSPSYVRNRLASFYRVDDDDDDDYRFRVHVNYGSTDFGSALSCVLATEDDEQARQLCTLIARLPPIDSGSSATVDVPDLSASVLATLVHYGVLVACSNDGAQQLKRQRVE